MDTFKRTFLTTLILSLGLSIAFLGGFFSRDFLQTVRVPGLSEWLGLSQETFPLLQEAHRILKEHALNPLPAAPALEYGMIRGMLGAYQDPHTVFLEPVQTELENNSLQGKFGGIGVRMGRDPEGFTILFPFPDSPAIQAGVQEGDRLLAIDGAPVTKDTPDDTIQAAIRGPVGQKVTLTLARAPDFDPQTLAVVRAEIPLPSVTWHIEPADARLGVIEINIIAESTPGEIQKAVADLQARGATHYVLDLRNNGGGLLDAGVNTARLFLSQGEVIQQQYRGEEVRAYRVESPGPFADLPLAVLVNPNTASASEIIAGALQAHQRAFLVGTHTYGKNTIQLVFTLRDGSSLHVTAARWWIPGSNFPNDGQGLQPDLLIPDNDADPGAAIQAVLQKFFGP